VCNNTTSRTEAIYLKKTVRLQVLTCGAVVDLAVPDAALTDDVPFLRRRATNYHCLITRSCHVGAARYHRINTTDHYIVHTVKLLLNARSQINAGVFKQYRVIRVLAIH